MEGTPDGLGDGFKTGGSGDEMGSLDKNDGHESMVKKSPIATTCFLSSL